MTICTRHCEPLFGDIVEGAMQQNDAGRVVADVWMTLPQRFPNVTIDEFTVMPNHLHGILVFPDCNNDYRRGESCIRPFQHDGCHNQGDLKDRPYGTLDGSVGRIVQAFKSLTTNTYIQGVKNKNWPPFPGKLWQRNYYERIIRDEDELHNARQYIRENPLKWETDSENPTNHPNGIP